MTVAGTKATFLAWLCLRHESTPTAECDTRLCIATDSLQPHRNSSFGVSNTFHAFLMRKDNKFIRRVRALVFTGMGSVGTLKTGASITEHCRIDRSDVVSERIVSIFEIARRRNLQ